MNYVKSLRHQIEEFVKDLRDGPHYCDVSYRRDANIANGLDALLDEAPNEDWQPLTTDTDLVPPDRGCLVLYHKDGNMHIPTKENGAWTVPEGRRVAFFADTNDLWLAGYTHYRVLRGPEGM